MGLEALTTLSIVDMTVVGVGVATAVDAATARSVIGAGTSSFDGAYASLSGIPIAFPPSAHNHVASDINSGTIDTARLGSGTADATTYLRGDQTWQTIAAGGISSVNGLTDATQTFQTGTTGTNFNVVSAAGVHTFHLPDASATARGVLTTGTQTIGGAKTFTHSAVFNQVVTCYQFSSNSGRCTAFNHFNAGGGFGYGFTVSTGVANPPSVLIAPIAATALDLGRIRLQYGASPCGFFVCNTYTSGTSYEDVGFDWSGNVATLDTRKGSSGGTLRGLKIGGAATSLLGFFGVTPVDQPVTVADPTGGSTIDAEARAAIGLIIDRLQELGLIA